MKSCSEWIAALIFVLVCFAVVAGAIMGIGRVSLSVSLDKIVEMAGWISAAMVCVILPAGFIVARLMEWLAPKNSHSVEDDNTYYAP